MAKRKLGKSPHTADTSAIEGVKGFAGIPRCVVESPAYRHLSLVARAILVELVSRMKGDNNGAIHVSYSELATCLNRKNQAPIGPAIAELMGHGLVDLSSESIWKERKAREYRLTFVNTTDSIGRPIRATNDYVGYTPAQAKNDATDAVAAKPKSATPYVAGKIAAATDAVAGADEEPPFLSAAAATDAVVPILKPSMDPKEGPDHPLSTPSNLNGPHCERCGEGFQPAGRGKPKRFCSERCRKSAEVARRHERQKAAA